MEFSIGDQIIGAYGNVWTREYEDEWFLENQYSSKGDLSDATAEWLINLKVKMPKVDWHDDKMSKSEKASPNTYVYSYTLRRAK